MPRPLLLVVLASAVLVAGCHLHPAKSKYPARPTYVSNPHPIDVNQRAAELQKHGYTEEAAMKRARKEAERTAWVSEGVSSAELQALQERREAKAKMEKSLAAMERDGTLFP